MAHTNPIPKGTVNVTVNVPAELVKELETLAEKSGVSRNRYCAEILNDAARTDATVELDTSIVRRAGKLVSYLKRQRSRKPK